MTARLGDLSGRGAIGLKAPKLARRSAEGRRHMARVAQLPCVICAKPGPSEVHHIISGRYGQRKSSDLETIPLCARHHRHGPESIHANKRGWELLHGPDYRFLPVVAAMLDDTHA